jgi:hypothetical protein
MGVTRVPPIDTSAPTRANSDIEGVADKVSTEDEKTQELLNEVINELRIINVHNELITAEKITIDDLNEE